MNKKKNTALSRDVTRNEYIYIHKITADMTPHILAVVGWLLIAIMIISTLFLLIIAIRNNVLDEIWYALASIALILLLLAGYLLKKSRHVIERSAVLQIEGAFKKVTQQLGKYINDVYYIGEYPVAIPTHWLKEKHLQDGLSVKAEIYPLKQNRFDTHVAQALYGFICLRINETYSIDQEVEKGLLRLKKRTAHLITSLFSLLLLVYSLLLVFDRSPFEYNTIIFISLLVVLLLLLYRSYRIFRYNRKILREINRLHQE
jgi:hypothetical protein